MNSAMSVCFALVAVATTTSLMGQESRPEASYFEQEVAASDSLRTQQAQELEAYIVALKQDESRLRSLFQPDYSSPAAFEKSAIPLRQAFSQSIGYPPPGGVPDEDASFTSIGEVIFEGGHEFHDDSAWAFVKRHL